MRTTGVSHVSNEIELVLVRTPEQISRIRELFVEYARSLSYHICFQSFEEELKRLPGEYSPPEGELFLRFQNGEPAGCSALRKITSEIGELRRLYVRPAFRGLKIGRELAVAVICAARERGYQRLRLDTLPSMIVARGLYSSLGFREISRHEDGPIDMELTLCAGYPTAKHVSLGILEPERYVSRRMQRRVILKCVYRGKATGHVSTHWATICDHHESELPGIRNFIPGSFNLILQEPRTYVPPNDHKFREEARHRGQREGNHISPLAKVIELNGRPVEAWLYRGGHPDDSVELLSKIRLKDFLGVLEGTEVIVSIEEHESET